MECCHTETENTEQPTKAAASENHHESHSQHDHGSHSGHEGMIAGFKKRFWVSLALTIPILLFSALLQRVFNFEVATFTGQSYVVAALASVIFFYGGKPFLIGAKNEIKSKRPGMMTLIGIAITVAYVYSMAIVLGLSGEVFFWELATLIDVMLLGHWIEMRTVMGASKALEEISKLLPSTAHKVVDGRIFDVDINDLKVGDTIVVKPGEKIPTDGTVTEGKTSVNEALVTGESKPVTKTIDSEVIGGSVNQDGSITVKVKHVGADSYLARVSEMVKNAQASRSKTQNLANRAALWLTIVAIAGGLITLLAWLIIGKDLDFALSRMVTVMVITCPHALGLAIPLVVSRSTTISAQSGTLIKNRDRFEDGHRVDTVVLDKTGTLTKGEFEVTDVISLGSMNPDDIRMLAASVESRSEHPLARPIVDSVKELKAASDFRALPGLGVEALVDGRHVKVVGPNYLKELGITVESDQLTEQVVTTNTLIYVLIDDKPEGVICLADQLRPESKSAIETFKQRGIEPVMLTGDSQAVAEAIAHELGIEKVFANVLPDQKQAKIEELKAEGRRVAMVGDGVNDAPALAAADFGIAIGAGADVAAETADVILVNSNPADIVKTLTISRNTYSKMKQNLWWASGYNIAAIPLAAGVLYSAGIVLSPAVGAALMSISTVVVAINARLLKMP